MRARRFHVVTLVSLLGLLGWLGAAVSQAGGVEDGKKLLQQKRYAEAADAFRGTLKAAPTSRDALMGLAEAVTEGLLSDAYPEVEEALQGAAKEKPDDRDLRLALGRFYFARAKEDDRYHADVEVQYRRLLKADPTDEDAVAGIARMHYERADFKRGIEVLDALLASKPTSALALLWRGEIYYEEGQQAFTKGGGLTPEITALFENALSAYQASAQSDPKRFKAWLGVGHAAHYLRKVDVAAAAYEKAIDLDGESATPMDGLSSLNASDPSKWAETVVRLTKEHAKSPIVFLYYGSLLKDQKKADEAEKAFRVFIQGARRPLKGWYFLGQVLNEKGDASGARKAYEEVVKADPTGIYGLNAVAALEKPLTDRTQEAVSDGSKAKALIKDYQPLLALAPRNVSIRNNLGFILREAFDKGGHDKALLEASVKYYEEASALIGPWKPEYEAKPYPGRHSAAQVLNDTGVMYHYYTIPLDMKKAESYYRAAQEFSQSGYWDAYTNLMKILEKEQRWQEAVEYAADCSGAPGGNIGLKNPDGSPNETFRANARGDSIRLEAKLPK